MLTLPNEIIEQIYLKCDVKSFCNLLVTCKTLNEFKYLTQRIKKEWSAQFVSISYLNSCTFGQTVTMMIPKYGDICLRDYPYHLVIKLPSVNSLNHHKPHKKHIKKSMRTK